MNISTCTAGDLMTATVVTIAAGAPVRSAIQKMHAERLQALVVPPTRPHDGYGILPV